MEAQRTQKRAQVPQLCGRPGIQISVPDSEVQVSAPGPTLEMILPVGRETDAWWDVSKRREVGVTPGSSTDH